MSARIYILMIVPFSGSVRSTPTARYTRKEQGAIYELPSVRMCIRQRDNPFLSSTPSAFHYSVLSIVSRGVYGRKTAP